MRQTPNPISIPCAGSKDHPPYNQHNAVIHNLNFGNTNTTRIATTINPAIQAYIIIRPSQPFPSVIVRKYPIFLVAASRPSSFLSKPLAALSSTFFSCSRVELNACEDSLSARAISRRDFVRSSCSVRWCVRRTSVVLVEILVVVVAEVNSSLRSALWRARRVDAGSG
jgi:hypothetical protein